MPVDFVETPAEEISDILTINIKATLRVTSAVTPGMVSRCVIWPTFFQLTDP